MDEQQQTSSSQGRRSWWWKVLGLRRRPGKRIPIGLTLWGWVLAVMVAGGGAMGAFAEYSMRPDFCRSCHLMEPYYQAWHSSTHKDVSCTQCHFEPGLEKTLYGKFQASSQAVKYITKTYGSKPHAEVHDSSCMRSGCHEQRVLEGKVDWTVQSSQGVPVTIKFDHKPHLDQERRGKQLRCVSCHSQIVQGQHLVVTLDTCYLCHFKGLQHGRDDQTLGGCNSCHEAPTQEIRLATGIFKHSEYTARGVLCENCHSDSVKGDGAVPRQVCWTCHNQTSQVKRYDDTRFVHEAHVTKHKVECSACHVQIEHSLSAGAKLIEKNVSTGHVAIESGACGQCHSETHGGPAELYRGTGARGIDDMPSQMYRAQVDCIACHKAKTGGGAKASIVGQSFRATQESCDYCHGRKYDGTLEQWKKQVAARLTTAEAAVRDAKAKLEQSKLSGEPGLKAQRLLDDAEHNIRLIKFGHGVHNVNYSVAALNVAIERCAEMTKLVEASASR
jgi:nitrate/TMAO reductase-like tetraheme cytochrome c subunit